ncbi:hypothetical protein A3J20_06125, partial [Candidatus Gottesmanbacteria bacterium RIFCSPLOWO2_02_FULL_42_29]
SYSRTFRRNFEKRIKNHRSLKERFETRIKQFIRNPRHPLLRDHALIGTKKDLRSFSITGDIRIIYFKEVTGKIVFLDIGTHNQIY